MQRTALLWNAIYQLPDGSLKDYMSQLHFIAIANQTAATLTSAAIPSDLLWRISAQATSTGTGAGTLQMQASNDQPVIGTAAPANWSNVGSPVTVAGAVSVILPATDISYQFIRFVYTNTGTGTIQVIVKALGA